MESMSGRRIPGRREFLIAGSMAGAATSLALTGCSSGGGTVPGASQPPGADVPVLFNGISSRSHDVYPFAYHQEVVNGRRIHYIDEGSGPIVMLLHGQGNWSYHYRGVINRLKTRARVICHDHLGSGMSEKPAFHRAYTIENHISILFGLIEQLDLRGITFYVMDWGGPIGFAYATTHPENVRGLVIGNTWAWTERVPFLSSPRWRTRLAPVVRPLTARMSAGRGTGLATAVPGGDWDTPEAREVADYPNRDTDIGETRGAAFNRSTQKAPDHPLEYLRRTARTFEQIERNLHKLQHLPVRVMAPDDQVFPPEHQQRWRTLFPKAPAVIPIKDHSHVAQASEQGSDIIARAIGEVLDEAGRA